MTVSFQELKIAPVYSQQDSGYLSPTTTKKEILLTTPEIKRDPLTSGDIQNLAESFIIVCDTLSRVPSQRAARILLQNCETIKAAHVLLENGKQAQLSLIWEESAIS